MWFGGIRDEILRGVGEWREFLRDKLGGRYGKLGVNDL